MQQERESNNAPAEKDTADASQHMATNPNPRANENIKESTIDKNTSTDSTPDVGSEITDGEAS